MAKNTKQSPASSALIGFFTVATICAATAGLVWGTNKYGAAGLIVHTAVVRAGYSQLLVVLDSRTQNTRGAPPPRLRSQVFDFASGSRISRSVLGSYRFVGAEGNVAWVWDASTGLSAFDLRTEQMVVSGERTRSLLSNAQSIGVHEVRWSPASVQLVLEDGRETTVDRSRLQALVPDPRNDESIPWSQWTFQQMYFAGSGARSELWVNNHRVEGLTFLQPSLVADRTLHAAKLVPELGAMLVRHRERFNGPFLLSAVTPDGRIVWNFPLERAGVNSRTFMQLYAVTYAQGALLLRAEFSGPSSTFILLNARTGALRWTAEL